MLLEEYCQKQKSEFMPLFETVRESGRENGWLSIDELKTSLEAVNG